MATNYPTSADDGTTLPNPTGSSTQNSPDHASLHSNANDAVKALEAKLGTGASTPTNNMFLVGTGTGSSSWSKAVPAGTVVGTSDSQTLTNKVLTSPTINSPTITNATISADTISEYTAANGVTIDGLNIKDGALNTNNSVPNSALSNTGAWGSAWAWASWVPTWTNLTIGNGTVDATYRQIGKDIKFRLSLTFGTTTSITGAYPTFTLPVTAKSAVLPGFVDYIFLDTGTQNYYGRTALGSAATTGVLVVTNSAGTYDVEAGVSSTVPFTWGNTDVIKAMGNYETT